MDHENIRAVVAKKNALLINIMSVEDAVWGAFFRSLPNGMRIFFLRVYRGIQTPREAIKGKCLECRRFQRNEVAKCDTVICPLHKYRPYQRVPKHGEGNEEDKD